MAITNIVERKGSGDFGRGPGGSKGQILFAVFGAESQDEALLAAENDNRAPPILNGYLRGEGKVSEQGPLLDFVDFDYERSIPDTTTDPSAGRPPEDSKPSPEGGQPNEDPVSRDMTFSTGGATRKITKSIQTRYKAAAPGDTAPDFKGLIGVDRKTGEIHGCEVLAAACDFTITKRFNQLTLGWFRRMLDTIACENSVPFLNLAANEVLFKGSDGNYRDGDPAPWTVTGKFGFSPNLVLTDPDDKDDCTFGDVTVPDINGWNYVWIIPFETTELATTGGQAINVKVSKPRWVYVEQVYRRKPFNPLGFN